MKLYKLTYSLLAILLLFSVVSCQDDEETNLALQILESDESIAPLVMLFINDSESTEFVFGDENASFTMTYVCDDPNIESHTTFVERVGSSDDPVELFTTTTFPSDVQVSIANIASTLGQNITDFSVGTEFRLTGTSIDKDGFTITVDNIVNFVPGEAPNAYNYVTLSDIEIVN